MQSAADQPDRTARAAAVLRIRADRIASPRQCKGARRNFARKVTPSVRFGRLTIGLVPGIRCKAPRRAAGTRARSERVRGARHAEANRRGAYSFNAGTGSVAAPIGQTRCSMVPTRQGQEVNRRCATMKSGTITRSTAVS